ncbi:hypothetical protein EV192_10485 [Actinocrispum wychmicini]|uniref:Uncharacterized protein n=1 Tax=Actinocrispum wychmicini TaxID=1213861 RepID=A0A4R2JJE7_9PSEU|nr:hypothetical protein EV192_10485 [Actinocrispum wychmicini]
MTGQHRAPLQHAPHRVRPPFNVAENLRPRRTVHDDGDAWREDRVAALLEALDGIELGAHDRRIIAWLAEWGTSTVGTVVSLLYRIRTAGADECGGGQ